MKIRWLLILLTLASPAFAGNGSERGGGDPDALEFKATGEEMVRLFERWERNGAPTLPSLDLKRLRAVHESYLPIVKDRVFVRADRCAYHPERAPDRCERRRWFDWFRGKARFEVTAANHSRRMTIEISASRWPRTKADPGLRYSIVLHEYLGLMGVQDRYYEVSEAFLRLLRQEHDLDAFKGRILRWVESARQAQAGNYALEPDLIMLPFDIYETTRDYQNCAIRPVGEIPEQERVAACLAFRDTFFAALDRASAVSKEASRKRDAQLAGAIQGLRVCGEMELEPGRRALGEKLASRIEALGSRLELEFNAHRSLYRRQIAEECTPRSGPPALGIACVFRKIRDEVRTGMGGAIPALQGEIREAYEEVEAEVAKFSEHATED